KSQSAFSMPERPTCKYGAIATGRSIMSWAELPAEHFIQAAQKVGLMILAERDAIERDRGLSPALFQAMRDAGLFSLWLPKSIGGPELAPQDLARVVEIISHADGSAGWLVGIATSNSRLAGYLPEPVARQIWGDGTSVLAGTLNPVGTAVTVPGGY